ncbi:MAG: 50S ribosomal protein L18 [Longimicrobiales bacterium]|nr:50S ribosomal protein L18 [Longimicrobiales bacterium]
MRKKKLKSRQAARARRHQRIRKRVFGTAERPRLVVYRSLRNVEGQLVDDHEGRTIVGLSTLSVDLRQIEAAEEEKESPRQARAFAAGKMLAERAKEAGIASVVFDRGGYKYHGRVKAFADGAREGGLEF